MEICNLVIMMIFELTSNIPLRAIMLAGVEIIVLKTIIILN